MCDNYKCCGKGQRLWLVRDDGLIPMWCSGHNHMMCIEKYRKGEIVLFPGIQDAHFQIIQLAQTEFEHTYLKALVINSSRWEEIREKDDAGDTGTGNDKE